MTTVINTVITIDLKEYAELKAIKQAARDLVDYRSRNTLNFQLEKADDFINRMRNLLDGDK